MCRLSSSSHASPGGGAHKSRISDSSKASRDSLDPDKGKETLDEVRVFAQTETESHEGQSDDSAGGKGWRRGLDSPGQVLRKVVSIGRIQLVKYQLREAFED